MKTLFATLVILTGTVHAEQITPISDDGPNHYILRDTDGKVTGGGIGISREKANQMNGTNYIGDDGANHFILRDKDGKVTGGGMGLSREQASRLAGTTFMKVLENRKAYKNETVWIQHLKTQASFINDEFSQAQALAYVAQIESGKFDAARVIAQLMIPLTGIWMKHDLEKQQGRPALRNQDERIAAEPTHVNESETSAASVKGKK